MAATLFMPGDPAPWFTAPTSSNPEFVFSSLGGRYVFMVFVSSSTSAEAKAMFNAVREKRELFADERRTVFGVTADPTDRAKGRVVDDPPGIRWFYDGGGAIAKLYGAVDERGKSGGRWILLDPTLRILGFGPLNDPAAMLEVAARLPDPDLHAGTQINAPVLIVPRVFEPEFCRHLIGLYENEGGEVSGFMREVDGKTTVVHDNNHKRRSDYQIADEKVRVACRARLLRRLVPEIEKAFQFKATRLERYIVACYDAAEQGMFRAHRDNTTKGTAHRKFAVTLNLNSDEYEGGELRFPEFGRRTYKPPTGGAVVFSCSLLHEATPVTKGLRYAFLPFLYDEHGARIREANNPFVDEKVGVYRSGLETAAAAEQRA